MIVDIQAHHYDLTPGLRRYIEFKVGLMFGRYQSKISRVEVIVDDINGPRGGEDQNCKLIISPINNSSIVIKQTEADIYHSVNVCFHRAKRALLRKVNFMRSKRRRVRSAPAPIEIDNLEP